MPSLTFDTHKFVRKLQEAGFDEKQAEGLTEAMRSAIAYFSPSWTVFQADRGRDFSVIVDGISN